MSWRRMRSGLLDAAGFAYTVDLSGVTDINKLVTSPTNAYAGYRFLRAGTQQDMSATSESWVSDGDWVAPKAADVGDLFEIRATLTAGSNPIVGTMGAWTALTATRTWYNSETGVGTATSTITFEIRDAATSTIRDTITSVLIRAEVTI